MTPGGDSQGLWAHCSEWNCSFGLLRGRLVVGHVGRGRSAEVRMESLGGDIGGEMPPYPWGPPTPRSTFVQQAHESGSWTLSWAVTLGRFPGAQAWAHCPSGCFPTPPPPPLTCSSFPSPVPGAS